MKAHNCNTDDQHDHKHTSEHHHGGVHVHPVAKNLWVALILNVAFTIIEFIGGILTNSVAILSDAIHDLGDSMAIVLSLILEKQSGKGRSDRFTYGKKRFSTLGALLTSLILVIGSIVITIKAIPRLWHPETVHISGVLGLSILGLIFNGAAVLRLKKGSQRSLNQRAVMLHLMEDALGWIAVLVGGVIMYFTDWYWIDPLLSLGIAAFILYNASKNIYRALFIFLQGTPSDIDVASIQNELLNIPEVKEIHDMHIWSMDGDYVVFTAHLLVSSDKNSTMNDVQQKALDTLARYNIHHPTIQLEAAPSTCALKDC